ncbi:carbon monoxide dehydrogenase subunit G [Bradyrhizobium sp. LB8.2]|uniref:SRPBCC family protein n=1 Tax=unclassified Bradyrhizobium TaxID=2631580 RepID=UPI003397E645
MKIEKSFNVAQPREHVWDRLNDVRFVADCLPGASIVSELGENRYKGKMSVKVGPMAATFSGDIAVESRRENWSCLVSGKGADSGSGSRASGSMTYSLADGSSPATTRVDIVSDINLAGPLAQFGKGPIVQEIANRITAAFVANFESRLTAAAAVSSDTAAAAPAAPTRPQQPLDAGGLLWAVLRDRLRSFVRGLFGKSPASS